MSSGKKSYLFIHGNLVGEREAMIKVLNRMSLIETWRFDMPNVFYIVSEATAGDLAAEFEKLGGYGGEGRYAFLEYSSNSQGRLTEDTWYLLNHRHHPQHSQASTT